MGWAAHLALVSPTHTPLPPALQGEGPAAGRPYLSLCEEAAWVPLVADRQSFTSQYMLCPEMVVRLHCSPPARPTCVRPGALLSNCPAARGCRPPAPPCPAHLCCLHGPPQTAGHKLKLDQGGARNVQEARRVEKERFDSPFHMLFRMFAEAAEAGA